MPPPLSISPPAAVRGANVQNERTRRGVHIRTGPEHLPRRASSAAQGKLITAEDPSYDEARQVVFKGVDKRPLAVVQAAGAEDVAAVVNAARDGGLELAVRSGGHSRPGYGTVDGGLVIDLSQMNGVEIDADGEAAWVETGATAGKYTLATAEKGRATGLGDTGSVGIGGITLAGGIGFLARKTGLTIDNLLAAEVVTADGEVVQASEDSEPDLFWAIRGGESNFGVATRFSCAWPRSRRSSAAC